MSPKSQEVKKLSKQAANPRTAARRFAPTLSVPVCSSLTAVTSSSSFFVNESVNMLPGSRRTGAAESEELQSRLSEIQKARGRFMTRNLRPR